MGVFARAERHGLFIPILPKPSIFIEDVIFTAPFRLLKGIRIRERGINGLFIPFNEKSKNELDRGYYCLRGVCCLAFGLHNVKGMVRRRKLVPHQGGLRAKILRGIDKQEILQRVHQLVGQPN